MTAPVRKIVIVAVSAVLFLAAAPPQTDDATIAHVLNRLGYGARPGDIEKVRQAGVINYIEQQLHPERIADSALEARLEPFTTLQISQSALAREYFMPAQQAKRQQK